MPTISIFIRKDDYPLWQQLSNKSQWLHNQLTNSNTSTIPEPAKTKPQKAATSAIRNHGLPKD